MVFIQLIVEAEIPITCSAFVKTLASELIATTFTILEVTADACD